MTRGIKDMVTDAKDMVWDAEDIKFNFKAGVYISLFFQDKNNTSL